MYADHNKRKRVALAEEARRALFADVQAWHNLRARHEAAAQQLRALVYHSNRRHHERQALRDEANA
jgi:hypothetical protein